MRIVVDKRLPFPSTTTQGGAVHAYQLGRDLHVSERAMRGLEATALASPCPACHAVDRARFCAAEEHEGLTEDEVGCEACDAMWTVATLRGEAGERHRLRDPFGDADHPQSMARRIVEAASEELGRNVYLSHVTVENEPARLEPISSHVRLLMPPGPMRMRLEMIVGMEPAQPRHHPGHLGVIADVDPARAMGPALGVIGRVVGVDPRDPGTVDVLIGPGVVTVPRTAEQFEALGLAAPSAIYEQLVESDPYLRGMVEAAVEAAAAGSDSDPGQGAVRLRRRRRRRRAPTTSVKGDPKAPK